MDKNVARLIFLVLLLIAVVGSYVYLLLVYTATPISISDSDKDKRILYIGSLEEDFSNNCSIRYVNFEFTDVSSGKATAIVEVALEKTSETVNGTLVFVLPHDAIVLYPKNLTVEEKSYAKVVFYPVVMQGNTSLKWCFVDFSWPTFSLSAGLGEWWFDIVWKSFSPSLDADLAKTGDVFYPLLGDILLDSFPLKIKVSLESGYTLEGHHPKAQNDYENEVTWSMISPWLGSHVTGNYVNNSDRSRFELLITIYPFVAGIVTSLVAREAYESSKKIKKQKSMDVDFDY